MDFHFCKSRFLVALLMTIIVVCLVFLLNGCYETGRNISYPPALVENGMSRQDFYSLLYKEITQDELLRSIYFPKRIIHDAVAVLCESSGELEFSEESHEALVFKAKTENIANLKITSKVYRQGDEPEQTIWLWQSRTCKPDDYAPWSSLIADFDTIKEENKAAVAILCEVGLAKLTTNQDDYSVYLYPDEIITESEANLLREKIRLRQRFEPSNAILTHDHNGKEIYLCFSDSISLFIFENIFAHLSQNNEILNSFVYFDEKGTELSLWINSVSGGMFSIPLNIVQGAVCTLPYYANKALLKQRLDVIKAMIPNSAKIDAERNFASILHENITGSEFSYTFSGEKDLKISISLAPSDSSSVIYIKFLQGGSL